MYAAPQVRNTSKYEARPHTQNVGPGGAMRGMLITAMLPSGKHWT